MQNNHLHPIFSAALAPFAPRTNVVSRVSHSRPVVVLEEQSANEGDFTDEDLAAIDAQFAPRRFVRTPELDKRVWNGDSFNANAWLELATGKTKFLCTGYDANAGHWLHLDDPARIEIDGIWRGARV